MAAIYRVQNKPTLIQISSDLVASQAMNNPIFQIFPIRKRNHLKLRWRIKDNYRGLMKLRGAGGEPTAVNPVGARIYEEEPGVFGEFSVINETELMELARGIPKDMDIQVDLQSEVRERLAQLFERQINRLRQMAWQGALTGDVQLALPGGGIGYSMQYTVQEFTPDVPWETLATATPLMDLQGLQVEYGRGTSNKFDNQATAYMNSLTAQWLFNNRNAQDWGGKKTTGGGTVQSHGYYDSIQADMKIPKIVTWDEGYEDEGGSFQLDIPDGEILVEGARPNGEKAGEIQMTYNAVSDAPGEYAEVHDHTTGPLKSIPPRVEVHGGFNGGQVVERPTQLLVMHVAAP